METHSQCSTPVPLTPPSGELSSIYPRNDHVHQVPQLVLNLGLSAADGGRLRPCSPSPPLSLPTTCVDRRCSTTIEAKHDANMARIAAVAHTTAVKSAGFRGDRTIFAASKPSGPNPSVTVVNGIVTTVWFRPASRNDIYTRAPSKRLATATSN